MAREISREERVAFAAAVVLEHMLGGPHRFPEALAGDDEHLTPVLTWLRGRGFVETKGSEVEPTESGRAALARFLERYADYRHTFDIYGAVDLEEGTFAYERFYEVDDDAAWQAFIEEERWEDLRLAVAEYKDFDPVELMVMSTLQEGRLETERPGWQRELLHGEHWGEMAEVIESALSIEDLAYEDDEGPVSGRDVIEDVIRQGAELNVDLKREEARLQAEGKLDEPSDDAYPVEAYEAYVDPTFVPDCWAGGAWYDVVPKG